MFKNVVVGVDGGPSSQDAVALARHLRSEGGRLTLAHVYPGEAYVWRGSNPAYAMAEEDDARALLERIRNEENLDAEVVLTGDYSVGKGLHLLAEQIDADLLVVGSSHHGLLYRVMLGDDTRAALNGAACAVAIAPAGYASEPKLMREIGVGYTGAPESEHALAVARELAAGYGAKLSAFEALDIPMFVVHGQTAVDTTPITDIVERARERITALGGVEAHAAYGDPAEELTLYSASLDLLVVGSRGYGPVGRLMHGSTSRRLARSARCPLLVLTRARRQAEVKEPLGNGDVQAAVARG